jgi:hypothetical protein
MLVGCISFGCHAGSPFFSHQRHKLLSRLCLILSTPLALSPQKLGHSSSDNNTRSLSLSLSLFRRSLARSVCSNVPAGLSRSPPPAARALRTAINFSPQKAGVAAERPAAHARRRKGLERTSTAPSSTLSPGPRHRLRSSSSAALAS